jgi:hypothetical protein
MTMTTQPTIKGIASDRAAQLDANNDVTAAYIVCRGCAILCYVLLCFALLCHVVLCCDNTAPPTGSAPFYLL